MFDLDVERAAGALCYCLQISENAALDKGSYLEWGRVCLSEEEPSKIALR